MPIQQICVYCASSPNLATIYLEDAAALGHTLAQEGITLIYGGGGTGLMGRIADAVLEKGGRVIGIMPHFMRELEWAHKGVGEIHFVEDMHARKKRFLDGTDAVVALPGGCGTLEELLEVITLKRLGLFDKPIIIVNTNGFYNPLIAMLDRTIEERFLSEHHRSMWRVVTYSSKVLEAVAETPPWAGNAR
jgi:uncharacterized protein (TIGR00730 family)